MRLVPVEIGIVSFLLLSTLGRAQQPLSEIEPADSTLKITARAVVVDVIVTDSLGKAVTGLPRDSFTVMEQGKPQTISFFEENGTAIPAHTVDMPMLPPNTFTNLSPFPQPPAVNVLLLDSLNTRMENQSVVHSQVLKFLKSAKPGTRSAIFTMGLGLHFIQGFNDDPAVLAAALNNKKNNEVETSVMLKGQVFPAAVWPNATASAHSAQNNASEQRKTARFIFSPRWILHPQPSGLDGEEIETGCELKGLSLR